MASVLRFLRRHPVWVTVVTVPLLLTLLVFGWWWHRYPYGWSHSCDKQLMFALEQYADEHGGAYPAGEATPEASLSLLYPRYANEWVLQGKIIPLETVQQVLASGQRLGPQTCGWHYVEGLRKTDNRRLALIWDKVGLGHNGERWGDGGHTVIFVGGEIDYIRGAEWAEFLREQQRLRAALGPDRQIRESSEGGR